MIGKNGLELHVGDIWEIAGNCFLILGERRLPFLDGSGTTLTEFPEFLALELTSQNRKKKALLFTFRPEVYTLVSCLVSHERLRE
jgi:hypothetical protein